MNWSVFDLVNFLLSFLFKAGSGGIFTECFFLRDLFEGAIELTSSASLSVDPMLSIKRITDTLNVTGGCSYSILSLYHFSSL